MTKPRNTKPMASFSGSGGGNKDDFADTGEFDTRRTHVFDRAPDGALVPVPRVTAPLEKQIPTVPPREMAVRTQIEAFRELRTRLLTMGAGLGRAHFNVLVVPIANDAGASFVARNLAAAFALQERGSAVLIDCDFRNPTQGEVLNPAANGSGLSDYLDQAMFVNYQQPVVLERLLQRTAIPNLHLIPAGRCEAMRAGRPREYFSSSAMRLLVDAIRGERETCTIVLDGPALDSSPDARILSALADMVVMVVAYGQKSHEDVLKAAESFDRAKFAGVVFNDRGAGARAAPRRR